MSNVTVFAVFIVLIASFAISVYTARRRSSDLLQDFLFQGNTPLLGLSSCIGSIVSMAVSFTALLSAGYEWGWQIIFPIVAGCACGLFAILKLTHHPKVLAREERIRGGDFLGGASYLATLGSRASLPYYGFLICGYLAMLITEMVVLRAFLGFLIDLPAGELILTIATILLVCYGYVYIGGFLGVLVTDYFQLMVVFVFVGLWLTSVSHHASFHVPSAFASHLVFTPIARSLLYVGVFAGAFAWMFASVDQWYRTTGTLELRHARRVLVSSAGVLCLFSFAPVLAGAAAIGRPDISPNVTNGVSFVLIADLLAHANTTVRFAFSMALTCAALTTLNTYLITMQQLYYEASTRIGSRHWLHYVVLNYPLKWKQVRGFVAIIAGVAFVVSIFFPAAYVYAFGVLALSTFILMLPFVSGAVAEMVEGRFAAYVAAKLTRGITVGLACIVWLLLLIIVRRTFGSLTEHLYLIPAAAFGAALLSCALSIAVPINRVSTGA